MASLGYQLTLRLVPFLVPWIVRFLFWTYAVRIVNYRVREKYVHRKIPFVGALWHEYMLMTVHFYNITNFTIMSSQSKDGEVSTRLLRFLGNRVVRGSSSSGGTEALRRLVRNVRDGYPAVFIADGPRGPRRVSKAGPVMAASLSRTPIIPLGMACSLALRARGWDKFAFPLPFSTIVLGYGDPIDVPPRANREEIEAIRARLDVEMARIDEQCRQALRG